MKVHQTLNSFLHQSSVKDEERLEVKDKKIIIKNVSEVRKNWDLAFKKISENSDDILLDEQYLSGKSSWDNNEWTW